MAGGSVVDQVRSAAGSDSRIRLLGFVPDELMDDPERTKAGLRNAYRRLLDLDFDRLLLAHGDPIVHGAKDELFAFVERV